MLVARFQPGTTHFDQQGLMASLRTDGYEMSNCQVSPGRLVAFPNLAKERWAQLRERLDRDPHIATVTDSAEVPPLVSLAASGRHSRIEVGESVVVGDAPFTIIAGPCAIENDEQMSTTARTVASAGAHILRGGAFKPRTSPYSFQGLRSPGLDMLAEAGARTGLPVITEVVNPADVPEVAERADILQIGTRNAQNHLLLEEVALAGRPVLLKRGFGCTVLEWLNSAEYLLNAGNPHVMLCERGIRSFEPATRFTLDISAVPLVKRLSHLPVIVDPSHACGRRDLVTPLAMAAAAAGADGVMVDVHPDGMHALCDDEQALSPIEFDDLVARLRRLLGGLDRELNPTPGSTASLTGNYPVRFADRHPKLSSS